jgi:hypothetical protein
MKHANSNFSKLINRASVLGICTALLFSSNLWSNTCIGSYHPNSIVEPLQAPIISFTAVPDGPTVNLEWELASESNKYFYTAEKSLDGIKFELIDKIDGSGETRFHTKDEKPWNGLTYYRIKQTDMNGKYSYSRTVTVKLSLSRFFNFTVYPNPTTGNNLKLKLMNVNADKVLVTVFNIIGNEVYSQVILVTPGEEFLATLILPSELNQGSYIVKIDANNSSCTKRFIMRKGA